MMHPNFANQMKAVWLNANLQGSITILVARESFALQQQKQISKQQPSAQQQLSASAPQMLQLHTLQRNAHACTFRVPDADSMLHMP